MYSSGILYLQIPEIFNHSGIIYDGIVSKYYNLGIRMVPTLSPHFYVMYISFPFSTNEHSQVASLSFKNKHLLTRSQAKRMPTSSQLSKNLSMKLILLRNNSETIAEYDLYNNRGVRHLIGLLQILCCMRLLSTTAITVVITNFPASSWFHIATTT